MNRYRGAMQVLPFGLTILVTFIYQKQYVAMVS